MRKYISISAFFFEAIISQTIFFLFNFPQSRYKWLPILAAKSSNFFGGRSWSRRLSIEVGEKRKKERGKESEKRIQGRARQGEGERGCSSFTGCISKGARVRCLRLINSDAARCTFKSPYILGYVLDGWMDGQARYKDRIAYPTGYRVLREVKWCGIDSLCVQRARVVYVSRSLFGPPL